MGGGGKEEEEERASSEATSRRWRMERKERERVLGEEVRHGKEET